MSVFAGPFVISLATADRRRAYDFYRDAFGFEAFGEAADDGVPEPLQFRLGDGAVLMFIPTGGFGWVLGDRAAAPAGTSECLLSLSVASEAEVDGAVGRVGAAGGDVLAEPVRQPWGYTATCADPDGHLWQIVTD
ncbi:VOC family protein [Actinomadura flavalba]|uniref:VOC family protein n=1 Tax=Actinomadura flavalba TaxID=1120938 RepID=UPI000477CAAE|nr:VOC family protein [Actinomadura flavalba]